MFLISNISYTHMYIILTILTKWCEKKTFLYVCLCVSVNSGIVGKLMWQGGIVMIET
mgnify:FL=1